MYKQKKPNKKALEIEIISQRVKTKAGIEKFLSQKLAKVY